ncbi:MAG: PQQ-binding-like beta-propeller repeat protein, partial [Planctomycetota bacterium]|nr:PQQ-binding-like beta-propeller repeat protein [Planctomycetota bacterium]
MFQITLRHSLLIHVLALAWWITPCLAQPENPVYVNDSPQAWLLFQQARDQRKDNVGESARLYQKLLDEYGLKLIPTSTLDDTHFASVRSRVLRELTDYPELLKRYRLIQTTAAQRMLEARQLEHTAQSYSLTEPGLEAILQLGQRHLESGAFQLAKHWLDEAIKHADLDERRAIHAWHMIGMATWYLQQPKEFEEILERLGSYQDGSTLHDHLVWLRREGPGPVQQQGRTSLDPSEAYDLGELISEDIWSVPLEHSLMNRRYPINPENPTQGRDVRKDKSEKAILNTATPTIAGEVVYINEGHTIHALDRFTGRSIWATPFTDQNDDRLKEINTENTMDLNIVSVQDGALVTLTGHLLPRERSNNGHVLCLDAASGEKRWHKDVSFIDEADEFERLFPHGQPLIAENSVYILARKTRKQQLTATYVIALDLHDGSLRWIRHISTSGAIRGTARPFSTIAYDRGSLFVATTLGSIARLEAHDGEIRWLNRYPVPLNPGASSLHKPWEFD